MVGCRILWQGLTLCGSVEFGDRVWNSMAGCGFWWQVMKFGGRVWNFESGCEILLEALKFCTRVCNIVLVVNFVARVSIYGRV